MESIYQIGKVNLKFNLSPHIFLSLLFLLLSPFLLGVENLDASRTARVLELYVSLLGIILLIPIFLPEQNKDVRDLMNSKFVPLTPVHIIRIIQACIVLTIFISSYIIYLKINNCTFPTMYYFWGTLAEAVFLGGMGVLAYSIFDQIAIAYMLPMVYYIMAMGGGSKLLKNFYLFSITTGSYHEKIYLGISGLIMIIVGIGFREIRKS
jgi:hypothetical protein